MSIRLFHIDAFTQKAFSGNPAGVCILENPEEEAWMQSMAQEMNLSETAFLHKEKDGYRLRWFAPRKEIDLCGHATLASAHVLWEEGLLSKSSQARFYTKSGLLTADHRNGLIEMNFPEEPSVESEMPPKLLEVLKIIPIHSRKSHVRYILEVKSESELRAIEPNFSLLEQLPLHGIVVTCKSDSKEYDFVSRYFAPKIGVPEDPVTGSAHCALAPYWRKHLGKKELRAFQASARGGAMLIRCQEDGRLLLIGNAVTVFRLTETEKKNTEIGEQREYFKENFVLSTDQNKFQIDTICGFLARTHWAADRKRSTIEKSIQNSLCYGIFTDNRQIGFARIITDYATFAYLCDVFVDEEYRGRGLSKWMMGCIMENPDLANLRRFTLATKDAHGLYERFGFKPLTAEETRRFMSILKENI